MGSKSRRREQDQAWRRARQRRKEGLAGKTDPDASPADDIASLQAAADAKGLRLRSYTIMFDRLDQPDPMDRVRAEVGEDEVSRIFDRVYDDPAAAIPLLEPLLERYPDVPTLYNWLATAYGVVGRKADANRLVRLSYERHPDYLFAKINYATSLIEDGQTGRVREIFNGTFDLADHLGRETIHITEFVAFYGMMVDYHCREGRFDGAMQMVDMVEKLIPGSDTAKALRNRVSGHSMMRQLRKLADRRYGPAGTFPL